MTEHLTDVVIDPRDTAANRERGWWRDATLYDDVAAAAARHPDKVAIVGNSPRPRPGISKSSCCAAN
jgi:non-ribosomal peptide synthetase component E (peptide arylation enzyme)